MVGACTALFVAAAAEADERNPMIEQRSCRARLGVRGRGTVPRRVAPTEGSVDGHLPSLDLYGSTAFYTVIWSLGIVAALAALLGAGELQGRRATLVPLSSSHRRHCKRSHAAWSRTG